MGPKDAPCEHPSPAKTSAPAPSAFTLPRPRSPSPAYPLASRRMMFAPSAATFTLPPPSFTLPPHTLRRRPRRFRPSAAAVIHNGLSTEKLSTSLLAALCKTFSPSRLRTRIYNISFARRLLPGVSAPLWGRGHAVVTPCPAPPSAGWGRAKAKVDAPSRSAEPCRLCAESLCAKAEVHKAIPAPARAFFPRQPAYRPPLPAYGRITVRKGGSAQGYPRPCPCVLPRGSLPTSSPLAA